MNVRNTLAVVMLASAGALWAETVTVPMVSNVLMKQLKTHLVEVSYTLQNGPAVITLDIQTNATANAADGWLSIGGENIQNFQNESEVWKVVSNGTRRIAWFPDAEWPGHSIAEGCCRAVVTAWPLDNTPDYMVVDIDEATAQPNTQRYYPSKDFVPGGVLSEEYRRSSLLMRKIPAKNVRWTMGSSQETGRSDAVASYGKNFKNRENTHQVTLTNNYYIGVFEVTKSQWGLVNIWWGRANYFTDEGSFDMRPVENVSINAIRCFAKNGNETHYENMWPNDPIEYSFLGRLRSRTGIDFDLPSEAQWEFAARAGHGEGQWGDGSPILAGNAEDANLNRLGRNKYNGGKVNDGGTYSDPPADCGPEHGPAVCGSYAPNDFGLYDMFGNVSEMCMDIFEENISACNGRINIDPADASQNIARNTSAAHTRVERGGNWSTEPSWCRPAFRWNTGCNSYANYIGFRLVCRAGLQ